MLFQAAQQRAQDQQQQQQCAQQQLHEPHEQGQAHQQQDTTPAAVPAQASSTAQAEQASLQAVMLVLQRLESKVDRLADALHTGLQQLNQRLAKLEVVYSNEGP